MQRTSSPLRGIIVEDEPILLMLLEDMLTDIGISVVGKATDVNTAMALAQESACDFAILDAHIVGGEIAPVFKALQERNVPVVFSTGDSPQAILTRYGDVPVLAKPYLASDLEVALQQICSKPHLG